MIKRIKTMINKFFFVARYNWFPKGEAIKDYEIMKDNQYFDFLNEVPDQYKSPMLAMRITRSMAELHTEFGIKPKSCIKWADKIMNIYNKELIDMVQTKSKLNALIDD